jgi:hypothetical protein
MLLFATYCSADKDGAAGDLPAIERYISDRINGVYANAQTAQARFGILSGMYGLISADHPLPYYDHLLQTEQIDDMVRSVQSTLTEWGVTEVRWFSVGFEMDPNVRRYRDVIGRAAQEAEATFDLTLWEPTGTLGLI